MMIRETLECSVLGTNVVVISTLMSYVYAFFDSGERLEVVDPSIERTFV
jgi:hypothetical protein